MFCGLRDWFGWNGCRKQRINSSKEADSSGEHLGYGRQVTDAQADVRGIGCFLGEDGSCEVSNTDLPPPAGSALSYDSCSNYEVDVYVAPIRPDLPMHHAISLAGQLALQLTISRICYSLGLRRRRLQSLVARTVNLDWQGDSS